VPKVNNEICSADGTRRLPTNMLPWREEGEPGFPYKVLHEGADRGQRTCLMRIEPGAFSPAHAHDEQEEVYVLAGSFYDEEQSYQPGDYILRPAGAVHTAGSESGCELLLIYRSAEAPSE